MIIIINLSIFISYDVFKSCSTFQLLAKTSEKLLYFILFLFKRNNNECLKNVSLVKGGQKKEDHSQQIPTFRCSEWSILKICILKILLLSPHRGDVASTCPGHCLI